MPSVTRIGSNTTMSPPCSRSVSRPVISRVPTVTVSVLSPGRRRIDRRVVRPGDLHAEVEPHRPAVRGAYSARR